MKKLYKKQTQLEQMLTFIKEGDKIFVENVFRLSRSTRNPRELLNWINQLEKDNLKLRQREEKEK